MSEFNKLSLAISSVALVAVLQATANAASPNVLLMMADDIGYGDLSSYGSEKIRTPVLDKLAGEGVRFTSFYAGASVCTPSRMALLSGCYPARLGWPGGVLGYRIPWTSGMSDDVYTIAEAFRDGGYRTALVGKWHIGSGPFGPKNQGFDESYFIVGSNNQGRDVYRGEELIHENYDNRMLTTTFTNEAIKVIESDSDKPFFLYVPFTAPHFPAQAHPDWKGRSGRGAYVDVVEELDHRIGEILAALDKQGIANDTIVVFISDNGPEGGQAKFSSAGHFSGRKWSSREGGTRVPGMIRYPKSIGAGQTSDALISAIDLYPTLASACGVEFKLPEGAQKMDGVDLWPALAGNAGSGEVLQQRPHLLYYQGWATPTAIRRGDWKLFFAQDEREKGAVSTADGAVLFNLAEDAAEKTNVASEHPLVVKGLLELAEQQLADIQQHAIPLGTQDEAVDK